MLLIKNLYNNQSSTDDATAHTSFKHCKFSKKGSSCFSADANSVYDVIMLSGTINTLSLPEIMFEIIKYWQLFIFNF